MSAWVIVFLIICVLALIIAVISLAIKYFSSILFSRLKSVKPKIIIYRADKHHGKETTDSLK
ncbi:MAG: hypothetical protein LUF33_09000 [Clostridiales bacterium]|nr:hypothetical protein [Clostridiales bacterium]